MIENSRNIAFLFQEETEASTWEQTQMKEEGNCDCLCLKKIVPVLPLINLYVRKIKHNKSIEVMIQLSGDNLA